jgi:hypothetical protein
MIEYDKEETYAERIERFKREAEEYKEKFLTPEFIANSKDVQALLSMSREARNEAERLAREKGIPFHGEGIEGYGQVFIPPGAASSVPPHINYVYEDMYKAVTGVRASRVLELMENTEAYKYSTEGAFGWTSSQSC